MEANLHLIGSCDSAHIGDSKGEGHVNIANGGGCDRAIDAHPVGLDSANRRAAITIEDVAIIAGFLNSLHRISTGGRAEGVAIEVVASGAGASIVEVGLEVESGVASSAVSDTAIGDQGSAAGDVRANA